MFKRLDWNSGQLCWRLNSGVLGGGLVARIRFLDGDATVTPGPFDDNAGFPIQFPSETGWFN